MFVEETHVILFVGNYFRHPDGRATGGAAPNAVPAVDVLLGPRRNAFD